MRTLIVVVQSVAAYTVAFAAGILLGLDPVAAVVLAIPVGVVVTTGINLLIGRPS